MMTSWEASPRAQASATVRKAHAAIPHADVRRLFGGARLSAQRSLIAECVIRQAGAFTAERLHGAVLAHDQGIGLATVYRALAAMHAAGSIERVGRRDGSDLLALCGGGHHHHAICDECGALVPIECPLEPDLASWVGQGGMILRHEITLYGLCPSCNARRGASS